ncbi:hypothetical protein COCC4DRAFT_61201 [Bipolaris maydis ATCC 48331]|uniref:Uncharacterized protein n=1 Tax=Cochliobolus heterostrophus (strain C4 / ATCC 48331 / race T) TaxID=665024 RepID=N4WVQ1_COCH4|nr:uncharacterized protein COCC4DRAFT_61201 [Bipolaris maydis ATCC 48331]ENI04589.1 hypothetical protein COCC4DRAFT_61201 [Bipolaris maydis ATCC 48331]
MTSAFCILSLEGAKASALVSDVLNATLGLVRMPQSPGSLGQSSRCTRHSWVKGKMHATYPYRHLCIQCTAVLGKAMARLEKALSPLTSGVRKRR